MDKIYSRPRLKLKLPHFQPNDPNFIKKKKVIKLIAIFFIAFLTAYYMIKAIEPIMTTMCEAEAMSIATKISNNQATEVMKRYRYEDLISISKDDTGNITGIKTNVIPVNEIISDVAVRIQNELNNSEQNQVSLSLGSFTGTKLLAGRGPKVPIKISNIGDVKTDFKSEFKEAGINQTLHRLYLEVKCKVSILTPFQTIEQEITNQVILAENIIVGKIPTTYYNLEGLNSTRDVLEIVD